MNLYGNVTIDVYSLVITDVHSPIYTHLLCNVKTNSHLQVDIYVLRHLLMFFSCKLYS